MGASTDSCHSFSWSLSFFEEVANHDEKDHSHDWPKAGKRPKSPYNFAPMSIEKDIQQRAFLTSRHKALVNILYTYGWELERIQKILSKENITHQQFNILRILRGSYPTPLSTLQIRERMLDKMSDTSRIVDRLILKEMATKAVSTRDKRLVDVIITEKGLDLLKRIDEVDIVSQIMTNVSEEEAEKLSNLLDKMRSSNWGLPAMQPVQRVKMRNRLHRNIFNLFSRWL